MTKSTQEWVKHGSNTTRNESTINHDDIGDNDEEMSWIRHQYVSRRELVDQNDPLMLVLVASYVSRVRKRSELIGGSAICGFLRSVEKTNKNSFLLVTQNYYTQDSKLVRDTN